MVKIQGNIISDMAKIQGNILGDMAKYQGKDLAIWLFIKVKRD